MIDDIIFGSTFSGDSTIFLLETLEIDGSITSYSLDNSNYDFSTGSESISIIIS